MWPRFGVTTGDAQCLSYTFTGRAEKSVRIGNCGLFDLLLMVESGPYRTNWLHHETWPVASGSYSIKFTIRYPV